MLIIRVNTLFICDAKTVIGTGGIHNYNQRISFPCVNANHKITSLTSKQSKLLALDLNIGNLTIFNDTGQMDGSSINELSMINCQINIM